MFDKEKVSLHVDTELCNVDITLYHNLNIIVGESGIGKTQLVNALRKENDRHKLSLSNGYKIMFYDPAILHMLSSSQDDKYIIVVDDQKDIMHQNVLMSLLSRSVDRVFLIVTREDLGCSSGCFSEAVYTVDVVERGNKSFFNLVKLE